MKQTYYRFLEVQVNCIWKLGNFLSEVSENMREVHNQIAIGIIFMF